jgi:hypothetical protein
MHRTSQRPGKTSKERATDAKAAPGTGSRWRPDDADEAEGIDAAKRTAQAISDHIAGRWQALPARSRLIVAGSWMAGAMGRLPAGPAAPQARPRRR